MTREDQLDYFDPWVVTQAEPSRRAVHSTRWRTSDVALVSPSRSRNRAPAPQPEQIISDAQSPPESAAEHLYDVTLERLRMICERLQHAGHRASVTADGNTAPFRLAMSLRPWSGLISKRRPISLLDLEITEDVLSVRRTFGHLATRPEDVKRMPLTAVDETWITGRAVDFVEQVLRGV